MAARLALYLTRIGVAVPVLGFVAFVLGHKHGVAAPHDGFHDGPL